MENNDQGIKDKIDELNQSAWDTRVNDSPRSFKLSAEALELLEGIDYTKGKADAFKCYGFALVRLSKNEEALKYLTEALSIFESINDLKGMAVANEYLGIIQRNWSNFGLSLELLKKALVFSQQAEFLESEATTFYQIGVTYKYLGNYEQALDSFNKSLSISRSIDYPLMEAYAINIIGSIYFDTGDYPSALNYYQRGLSIRKQSGDKWGEAGSLDNIGYTYLKLEDWQQAIDFCEKALSISKSNDDKRGQANALFHLAEIYKQRGEWQKADLFSGESLQIRREVGDKKGEAELILFLADLKKFKGTSEDEIQEALQEALKISDAINAADISGKAHWALYESQKRLRNYNQALIHLEKYIHVEKQLHKDSVNQKVLNCQISQRAEDAEKEAIKVSLRNEELATLNAEINTQKQEIENTLTKLRETQSQLIQSEKMASLGELTAGIAHEIQNPLNFVNNFSEVNKELLEELKDEADKRNINEVKSIADDVIENSEKINHHGKRADAIVKGMLQHSRQTLGVKEPTDINALCDEYLRLSYHGLRAKDKSFNADFKTDFDNSIGKINIISQDIGRVLLNLYNNAFYVVVEKMKAGNKDYQPTVSVSTKKTGDKILISVNDNGNGISQSLVDKIFQPFFTTKPTGQGTGLGLSLSYDIVKAHGGEINVETRERDGSKFLVILPIL